jgi:YegS/Rv2252/BmrU family lipid kinase
MGSSGILIYNPAAGAFNVKPVLPEILQTLALGGWQVELRQTHQPGDIGRFTAEAVQRDADVVFVAGGDGSLNEAVNHLAHSRTALGVIPTGTSNVWARLVGMPMPLPWNLHKLVDGAQVMVDGCIRTVDLGLAEQRYFLMWSGVGLDGEIASIIEPKPAPVRRFGMLGYAAFVIAIAFRYRGVHMTIETENHTYQTRSLLTVASNGGLYGGILRIAPQAMLDDGYLDVCIFRGENILQTLFHAAILLAGKAAKDPRAIMVRAQRIQVSSLRPCYVQVDGEPFNQTPVNIEVVPKALRVLVPKNIPQKLFSSEC